MNEKYIIFLQNVKEKFKNKEYKIIGNKKIKLDLMEMINRYITYLWYKHTNDNMIDYDILCIPNNLKEIDFSKINFLDVSNILSYIKYNLLNEINDIIEEEKLTKKYLNNFTITKLKKFTNQVFKLKNQHIEYILKNKKTFFKHLYINESIKEILTCDYCESDDDECSDCEKYQEIVEEI